jgi:hypothetical protein
VFQFEAVKVRLAGDALRSASPPVALATLTAVVPGGWEERRTVKVAVPPSGTLTLLVDAMMVGVCKKLACTAVSPVIEIVVVGLEALTRLAPVPETIVHPAKLYPETGLAVIVVVEPFVTVPPPVTVPCAALALVTVKTASLSVSVALTFTVASPDAVRLKVAVPLAVSASSPALTVTVCGVDQLEVVKVRLVGLLVRSASPPDAGATLTVVVAVG